MCIHETHADAEPPWSEGRGEPLIDGLRHQALECRLIRCRVDPLKVVIVDATLAGSASFIDPARAVDRNEIDIARRPDGGKAGLAARCETLPCTAGLCSMLQCCMLIVRRGVVVLRNFGFRFRSRLQLVQKIGRAHARRPRRWPARCLSGL